MSKIIKKIKIKKQDGTYTDYIPIGAEAKNVDCSDGESVEYKFNKKPYYYNSVADMKADTKLKVGNMVITTGYHTANDGGTSEYTIVTGSFTEDDGSVIRLDNNLYAQLIVKNNTVNVEQFGAYGNGTNDDAAAVQKAINFGSINHYDVALNKKYLINTAIEISHKDGFRLIGNNQMFGHVIATKITAPNGFLRMQYCMKVNIVGLSIDCTNATCIEFYGSENRWNTIERCQFSTHGIGIDAKSLYYSHINDCHFNYCLRAMSFGNNGSGVGSITINRCHIMGATTVFYMNTDSMISVHESCIENVATILYNLSGNTSITNTYMADGFRQGFIMVHGSIWLSNIVSTLVSTRDPNNTRPSEFTTDRCVIDLQNDSWARLSQLTFDEYYSDAPIIKMSESATIILDNTVKFKGYRLLETTQQYLTGIGRVMKNYITGIDTSGRYTPESGTGGFNFSSSTEIVGTNYMGEDIIKYTNTGPTYLAMQYHYSVPKAGWYLLQLKMTSNYDYDRITFKTGCKGAHPSYYPDNKYKRRVNNMIFVNPDNPGVNVIMPVCKTYPEGVAVMPVYIDKDHLTDTFLLCSQQYSSTDTKTIDFIGLVDCENPFSIPNFRTVYTEE